jgi:HSP20 family protein
MPITRWRAPTDSFNQMEQRMQQFFDRPFRLPFIDVDVGWAPSVEVSETNGSIEVTAEIPGVTRDDIEVDLENNILTIRGEKKEEIEEKEKETYLYERFYGSFHRSIALPAAVDEEKVNAEFRNGVLKVRLQKTTQTKGRKIEVTG